MKVKEELLNENQDVINTNTAEIEHYKDLYMRALADYQNLQKRSLEEKRDIAKRASYDMLLKIIPLYHDVKRGLSYNEVGAKLIYNKFVEFLKNNNIEIIDVNFFKEKTDNIFTEEYATAISIQNIAKNDTNIKLDNKIYKIVEDGFYDNENHKVISYAKVIVYKVN